MKRVGFLLIILALVVCACGSKATPTPTAKPIPAILTFVVNVKKVPVITVIKVWEPLAPFDDIKGYVYPEYGQYEAGEGVSEKEAIAQVEATMGLRVLRLENPGKLEFDHPELTAYRRLWVAIEFPSQNRTAVAVVLWKQSTKFYFEDRHKGSFVHNWKVSQKELVDLVLSRIIGVNDHEKIKVEVSEDEGEIRQIRLTGPSNILP